MRYLIKIGATVQQARVPIQLITAIESIDLDGELLIVAANAKKDFWFFLDR